MEIPMAPSLGSDTADISWVHAAVSGAKWRPSPEAKFAIAEMLPSPALLPVTTSETEWSLN